MTKAETAILEARDPAAYIEASLKARIAPSAKARLARLWMDRTGYTKEDILHARNRHPYWKKKKMEGSAERTRQRLSAHDYSVGGSIDWNVERVAAFLDLNAKDRNGRYEHRDWQIAESFGSSIPSVQYMRRKYRRAMELLGPKAPRARLVEYLTLAESVLLRGPKAVEGLRAERAAAKRSGSTSRSASPAVASSGRKAGGKASAKAGTKVAGAKAASKRAPAGKSGAAKPKAKTTKRGAAKPKATKAKGRS